MREGLSHFPLGSLDALVPGAAVLALPAASPPAESLALGAGWAVSRGTEEKGR